MRRVSRGVLGLVLATSAAAPAVGQEARKPGTPAAGRGAGATATTAPPAASAAKPPARPKVDPARMTELMKHWEQQSARLMTLDVKIRRVDRSEAWGEEAYEGRAILKTPDLAWLDFNKVSEPEKGKPPKLTPADRIICTGAEVWQFVPDSRQILIFPLNKETQQRALEEGPLRFLFNMRAADAEKRYQMQLVDETKDFFVISIIPRLKIDQESFKSALLRLNRRTFLPDRIFLTNPNGTSSKDFLLTEAKANAPVVASNFQPKAADFNANWQIVRDPANPPASAVRPAQGAAGRPPAAAPASGGGARLRRQ